MPAIGPIGKRRVMPTRSLEIRGHDVERDELRAGAEALGLLSAEPEKPPVDLDESVTDRLAGLDAIRRPSSSRRA